MDGYYDWVKEHIMEVRMTTSNFDRGVGFYVCGYSHDWALNNHETQFISLLTYIFPSAGCSFERGRPLR